MSTAEFLATNLPAIAPEIGLTILAVIILLLDSYLPDPEKKGSRKGIAYVAALTMGLLAITPLFPWQPSDTICLDCWGGMIRYDVTSQVFKVMVLLAGALTSLMAVRDTRVGHKGEFYLIITISTLGGCLMAGASDMIMLFVALETVSIPLYILAAFDREQATSSESGLKYYLFGSFASAMLLYGLSLLYGFTGETNLSLVADAIASGESMIGNNIFPALIALVFIVTGFGFKISAAPFHFWTPDVYQGAPTPVTAFVSVASKAASFALLMRFFANVFPDAGGAVVAVDIQSIWANLLAVMAVASMTIGNFLALRQNSMKRMLAYSSIAQAGYALVGVVAIQSGNVDFAVSSVAFYLFMYTFSNLLVFAGVLLIEETVGTESISEYGGLQRRNPMLALVMTIGLLSLAGIPPAAGFFGKFFLFQAAVNGGFTWLALIGFLNSLVALYYYLIVIKVIYVDSGKDEDQPIAIPAPLAWTLGITTIIVLLLGILPTPIIQWARSGADAIQAIIALI